MMRREARLQRLIQLRTLQHNVAGMSLRVSRGMLLGAEAAQDAERDAAAVNRGQMDVTLQAFDHDAWLFNCSDTAWSKLAMDRCVLEREAAENAVNEAAVREAAARRESMQMQASLERLQRTAAQEATRVEQRSLDETIRLLQYARSRSPQGRVS
jgi:hypothetical protein